MSQQNVEALQRAGRESGIEFDSPYGALAEFKNGEITRYRVYFDHSEALEAAGLSE